jgi:hypothetical protein
MSRLKSILLITAMVSLVSCTPAIPEPKEHNLPYVTQSYEVAPGDTALATDISQQNLRVTPLYGIVNEPVAVRVADSYSNGCYRQSGVETDIETDRIAHSYRIWIEDDFACTDEEVPGGFSTTVVLQEPGLYHGIVNVNEKPVAYYSLHIFPDRQTAVTALGQALKGKELNEWEVAQVAAQVVQQPNQSLEQTLLESVLPEISNVTNRSLWNAIMTWLEQTPHLDVVEAARPALEKIPEENKTTYGYTKWRVLARIATDAELNAVLDDLSCNYSADPAHAVFYVALEQERLSLCPAIVDAFVRTQDCEVRRRSNLVTALVWSPACSSELASSLKQGEPDFFLLNALIGRAGEEPFRSVILAEAARWRDQAEQDAYNQWIIEELVATAEASTVTH